VDIVYVCRAGRNEELRYSLRSLANLPHERVWIAGDPPDWVTNVTVIRVRQGLVKHHNAMSNWRRVLDQRDLPDQFTVMDDDFFVVAPVDEVIATHRGPLLDQAARINKGSNYGQALRRTYDLLVAEGISCPLSFENHMPLVVDKDGYAKAVEAKLDDPRLHERSIYANRAGVEAVQSEDCKVYEFTDPLGYGPYASTTDNTFARGLAGKQIRALFPAPCSYERGRS